MGDMMTIEQLLLPFDEAAEEAAVELIASRRVPGEWYQAFITAMVDPENRGNQTRAVHLANDAVGLKPTTDNYAKKRGSELMAEGHTIRRLVDERRAKAAQAAEFTEEELYRSIRLMPDQGHGIAPVRKVLSASFQGDITCQEVEVRETNLAAVGKANEMIGKALGVFKEQVDHGASSDLLAALAGEIKATKGPPSERED